MLMTLIRTNRMYNYYSSKFKSFVVHVAGLSAGAVALSTEVRKHSENHPKCIVALGSCCIPLIIESYGAWGKEAIDTF